MRYELYAKPETIDKLSRSWLETLRENTAGHPKLKFVPSKSALIVVDMLCHFASQSGRNYLPITNCIIPNIQKLLRVFHKNKNPVIFTRHFHEDENNLGMFGKFYSDYIRKDEEDSFIIDELTPDSGDIIINKNTYDAFYRTELLSILENKGISQVVITGLLTHMCCETTARSAFNRGFEVYIPIDAMASTTYQLHFGSLFSMDNSVAIVKSTKEMLKIWKTTTY